jgi:ribbon-helix-helix CopG family protein
MRTTVEFDDDTARAVDAMRRERGVGVSEAVNELIRRGLLPHPAAPAFHQRTAPLRLRVDVSNIADALEALDGATTSG